MLYASLLFTYKRETGIEPATPSLARRCSTAEPLAHILRTSYNILEGSGNVNKKSVPLFCKLHIQLTQQYSTQPSGEFPLYQDPAQISQNNAYYNAYDQSDNRQYG